MTFSEVQGMKKAVVSMEMTDRTANQPLRDIALLKATPNSWNSLSRDCYNVLCLSLTLKSQSKF